MRTRGLGFCRFALGATRKVHTQGASVHSSARCPDEGVRWSCKQHTLRVRTQAGPAPPLLPVYAGRSSSLGPLAGGARGEAAAAEQQNHAATADAARACSSACMPTVAHLRATAAETVSAVCCVTRRADGVRLDSLRGVVFARTCGRSARRRSSACARVLKAIASARWRCRRRQS